MLRVSWRYSIWLIAFVCFSPWVASDENYRDDYVYNENNQAFYKLHKEKVKNVRARKVCDLEGTTLMDAASHYDAEFVKGLFKQFPDIGTRVWIGDGNLTRSAADQKCTVMNSIGQKLAHACQNEELPFVCKVLAVDAPYNIECVVNAKDYKQLPNTGSCYKIPRIAYTWDQANAECRSEGANLVVLNSEAERIAVLSLIKSTTMPEDSSSMYYYLAGMRAYQPNIKPKVFLTIFNQTLEQAGYSEWASGEPNNDDGLEHCGTLFTIDGKYNDYYCDKALGFICEKEIFSTDSVIDISIY